MLTENKLEQTEDNKLVKPSFKKENAVEKASENVPEQPIDGDIDLSATRKKRFRINGDNNAILELNTSDMNVITRLENLYPKLEKLSQDAAIKKLDEQNTEDERDSTKIANALVKIDMSMREILDEIFDSNVSEVCAPAGSMFDPFNGRFRYEHIMDVLTKLYENNINTEFKKMSERMKKRTSKYTKGK